MTGKKIVINGKGNVDQISIETYELQQPAEKDVQIEVVYAGLAYADVMLRKSSLPGLPKAPFTPGADAVGIVKGIGSNVSGYEIGDRVSALLMSDFGGQAQYINVHQKNIRKLPDDISDENGLCLLINYLTAYGMIIDFESINKVENPAILVHGGSGGVGSALIQIAVAKGYSVYSTASTKNLNFVENQGAIAIDYRNQNFETIIRDQYNTKVDGIFDPIGGSYVKKSMKVLNKNGIYYGYGFQAEIEKGLVGITKAVLQFTWAKLMNPSKTLKGYQLRNEKEEINLSRLEELYQMVRNKEISPFVSKIMPYQKAREAHKAVEQGKRTGKILIKMQENLS